MELKFNLKDDQEFKNSIKELIRAEVKAVTREETQRIVREEMEKRIKAMSDKEFQLFIKDSMDKVIKNILMKEHRVNNWGTHFITPIVTDIITKKALAFVDDKYMTSQLEKELDTIIRQRVLNLLDKK